jgi:hypothetical protein
MHIASLQEERAEGKQDAPQKNNGSSVKVIFVKTVAYTDK